MKLPTKDENDCYDMTDVDYPQLFCIAVMAYPIIKALLGELRKPGELVPLDRRINR